MKCSNCGAEMKNDGDGMIFCPYCGKELPRGTVNEIHIKSEKYIKKEIEDKARIEKEKATRTKARSDILWLVIPFAVMIFCILLFYLGSEVERRDEERLQALLVEIQKDCEAGNYDVALIKSEGLRWPHSGTSSKNRWDEIRSNMIKMIKELQQRSLQ